VGNELEKKRKEVVFAIWLYFGLCECVLICNVFNTSVSPKTIVNVVFFNGLIGVHCTLANTVVWRGKEEAENW
jgi:hypothetical protein